MCRGGSLWPRAGTCLGKDWKLDEVSSLFLLEVDRARTLQPRADALPRGQVGGSLCLSYGLESTLLSTSVIFSDKHISFLSQLCGNDPWICDMSFNNIFCFYGAFSWVGLDNRGKVRGNQCS